MKAAKKYFAPGYCRSALITEATTVSRCGRGSCLAFDLFEIQSQSAAITRHKAYQHQALLSSTLDPTLAVQVIEFL